MLDKYIDNIPLQPGALLKTRVVVSKKIRRKGWKKPLWILSDDKKNTYTISSDVVLSIGDSYVISGVIKRVSSFGNRLQYHLTRNLALMIGGNK